MYRPTSSNVHLYITKTQSTRVHVRRTFLYLIAAVFNSELITAKIRQGLSCYTTEERQLIYTAYFCGVESNKYSRNPALHYVWQQLSTQKLRRLDRALHMHINGK